MSRNRRIVALAAQHLAVILAAVLMWETAIRVLKLDGSVLPTPRDVASALLTQFQTARFWLHVSVTGQEILLGFLLGCSVAFTAGVLVAQSRLIERTLAPYVIALETIPKIALAPLFVVWFGFGLTSKVVTTALICFFPMFINVLQGMKTSSRDEIEMLRSAGAGRLALIWRLQLPNSLPLIFAALDICVILAVIGAVVAEYVGASSGLGYQLLLFNRQLRTAEVFSNIVVLSLIGLIGHMVIRLIQRRLVFWASGNTMP